MNILVFDIDGTLLRNTLPAPDWDNPQALHPITGESINGLMTEYNSHCEPAPDMQYIPAREVRCVLSCRPECRWGTTVNQLAVYGICPDALILYPMSELPYSTRKGAAWKASELVLLKSINPYDRIIYVDSNPEHGRSVISCIPKQYEQTIITKTPAQLTPEDWDETFTPARMHRPTVVGKIHNPVTGKYYPVRQPERKNKEKPPIRGLWTMTTDEKNTTKERN